MDKVINKIMLRNLMLIDVFARGLKFFAKGLMNDWQLVRSTGVAEIGSENQLTADLA
jgi:hypothetical protein